MLRNKIILSLIILFVFLQCAFAELAYVIPVTNQSVLDQVVQKFGGKVKSWQTIVQGCSRTFVLDTGIDFYGLDIRHDVATQS